MLKEGDNLRGESSGHLIFSDHGTTGDGLVTALQILGIMKSKNQSFKELAGAWTRFPQLVTNIQVRSKVPFEELEGVTEWVARVEKELKPEGGRVLLRYSGTEPKARLLVEGPDMAELEKWSSQISLPTRDQVGAG